MTTIQPTHTSAAPAPADDATEGPHCEFSADDFRAVATGAGAERRIRVTGGGLCPSAGWGLALDAANPGVVPHPESLWVQLRELPPTDASARVLTDTEVEATFADDAATEVVIRFSWREPIPVPVVDDEPGTGTGDDTGY
ncbi:hypothetical protein ACGGZK_06305 [Agromyces sp. MMS24-K17]|uniref:hypothetical protein n=1 Tax=Agromyces sp. MMS24-K17 TaxID=3372850 RepID=UPI0037545EFA